MITCFSSVSFSEYFGAVEIRLPNFVLCAYDNTMPVIQISSLAIVIKSPPTLLIYECEL